MSSQPQITVSDALTVPIPDQAQVSDPQLLPALVETSQVTEKKPHKGRWKKGECGNPLGRPPTRFVSAEFRKLLAKGKDKHLARRVMKIALESPNERNALAAATEIMDRTEGKAVATMVLQQQMDERGLDRMAELAERLAALAKP